MAVTMPERRLCPSCLTPLRDNEEGCGFPPRETDERLALVANALREHEYAVQGYSGYLAWSYLKESEQERWLALARVAAEALR